MIYKIKPDGTGYDSVMNFNGSNGRLPLYGSLYYDGSFLYGMTPYGGTGTTCGAWGCGVVFKVKPDGTGSMVLHNFLGAPDGGAPWGSLISDGTFLYGMVYNDGTSPNQYGNVFKIKPDGTGYDTLINFNGFNGGHPAGSLTLAGGLLYGMTSAGGAGNGNIFKIKTDGTGFDTLSNFNKGANNGATPYGSLIVIGGCLYGTTSGGGAGTFGEVFKFCGIATGIEPIAQEMDRVNVYPNPNNGTFTVENHSGSKQLLQVFDLNGKLVLSQILESVKTIIGSMDLPQGVYDACVSSDMGRTNQRLVVIR